MLTWLLTKMLTWLLTYLWHRRRVSNNSQRQRLKRGFKYSPFFISWSKHFTMKILIAVLFALSILSAFSQTEIKLDEVKNHVNDSVKVRGVIKGIRYLEAAKGSLTFLNLGRAYPKQFLTIVFFEKVRI